MIDGKETRLTEMPEVVFAPHEESALDRAVGAETATLPTNRRVLEKLEFIMSDPDMAQELGSLVEWQILPGFLTRRDITPEDQLRIDALKGTIEKARDSVFTSEAIGVINARARQRVESREARKQEAGGR